MPSIQYTTPDGHTILLDVTGGVYTRTVDGTRVEQRLATTEEKSNFGAALPAVPPTPLEAAQTALARAVAVAAAPAELAAVNALALAEEGVTDGQEWRQPQGAHDSYPQGWKVSHVGKTWESLVPANVWAPGDPADPQNYRWWKDLTTPQTGAWQAGKAYTVGATVTYGGKSYTCLQAHTSQVGWEPPNVPALWKPA